MNLAARFAQLLPSRRPEIVTVVLLPGDGTSVVENNLGDQWRVLGDSVPEDSKALVQEGLIVAQVADLETFEVTG